MSLVEIEWDPNARQLRVFGISGLVASIVAALVLRFVWGVTAGWSLAVIAVGIAVFLVSLSCPRLARALYVGLTVLVLPIGLVVSFVLLAAFYFLLLTPIALVFKVIGRDPLGRRFDPGAASYWVPRRRTEGMERYFHQF